MCDGRGHRSARVKRPRRYASVLGILGLSLVWASGASLAQTNPPAAERCGERIGIETHAKTTTHYALARPSPDAALKPPIAVVLLPGGGGHIDLDANACPRALVGNFLIRSLPHFHAAGFVTALVDARSDHAGEEGLAGLRISPQHAEDLGKVIADLRARTGGLVWIVGTSRGTISAANAAARLSGASAPDGLVLTSTLSVGGPSRQWPWVRQTVFDLPLDAIRMPTLIVGHAEDGCVRTPPAQMSRVASRVSAARKQVVMVTGGSGATAAGVDACAGPTAHGFLGQEAEVVGGIARFIRGEGY